MEHKRRIKRGKIFTKVKMRSKCPQKSDASDVFHMEKPFLSLSFSLFCSSRLLFPPSPILIVLCENRFRNSQNKWKHNILRPRHNWPWLRSLDLMPRTILAVIPGHGLWLWKKTSLFSFQKWFFSPAFLDSWIIWVYSSFQVCLCFIPSERGRMRVLSQGWLDHSVTQNCS